MATLEPITGCARVVAVGSSGGVPVVNVFHWRKTTPAAFSQAEIDNLSAALRTAYVTRFIPLIGSNYSLGDVTATDLSSELGVVGSTAGSTAGGMSATSLPASVAQCITWRIARHYRGGHPRTYLPAPTANGQNGANSWATAHVTAMNTAANGFRNDMAYSVSAGNPGTLVCVHRFRGKIEEPGDDFGKPKPLVPPLVDVIADATFDSRIDSQRRRLGADR